MIITHTHIQPYTLMFTLKMIFPLWNKQNKNRESKQCADTANTKTKRQRSKQVLYKSKQQQHNGNQSESEGRQV